MLRRFIKLLTSIWIARKLETKQQAARGVVKLPNGGKPLHKANP